MESNNPASARQCEESTPVPRLAELARFFWERANPVRFVDSASEPFYLLGFELREYQSAILSPIYDADGVLVNLARFYRSGEIRLLGDVRAVRGDE